MEGKKDGWIRVDNVRGQTIFSNKNTGALKIDGVLYVRLYHGPEITTCETCAFCRRPCPLYPGTEDCNNGFVYKRRDPLYEDLLKVAAMSKEAADGK